MHYFYSPCDLRLFFQGIAAARKRAHQAFYVLSFRNHIIPEPHAPTSALGQAEPPSPAQELRAQL